jgi:hypothetical protein
LESSKSDGEDTEEDLMADIDEVELVSSSRVSHDEDVSAEGRDLN